MSSTAADLAAILPAAGSGRRFGRNDNKLFARLAGRPIWLWSALRLRSHPRVKRVVMPVSTADRPRFESDFAAELERLGIELVAGGAERTDSVRAGLEHVAGDAAIAWVAIHDAARPLVRRRDLDAVFARAADSGAAILAQPVTATVKRSTDEGRSSRTLDRRGLWLAQTPQVFRVSLLRHAYQRHRGRPATDDAELVERSGVPVALVPGAADNLKITHPHDLILAEAVLQTDPELNDA